LNNSIDSYGSSDNYPGETAGEINIAIAPQVIYLVSENIELFLEFFRAGYRYAWNDDWTTGSASKAP
jgi:hypothetical protein